MYACKFFPDTKTADHIQISLNRILIEAGIDAEYVPCTTDKGQLTVDELKELERMLEKKPHIILKVESDGKTDDGDGLCCDVRLVCSL